MPSLIGLLLAALVCWALAVIQPVTAAQAQSFSPQDAGLTRTTEWVSTTRELTQTIAAHTDTFTVITTGTVRPENLYLRIENVGTTAVVRPKIIVNGQPDWWTIDSILAEIIEPGMSDEEKARAIWQFARTARYHWWPPSWLTLEARDPVKLFNVYGYGFCNDVTPVMAALFEHIGLPSRTWHVAGNQHNVPEVWYDGDWHLLDADRGGLYLERDNRTIAGVEEILDDLYLVERAGPAHADLVPLYAATSRTAHVFPGENWYEVGHEISLTLRPREVLVLNWQATGPYHDDTGWEHPAPPEYANGQLVGSLDLSSTSYRQWIVREAGLRAYADDRNWPMLSPQKIGVPGELVYQVDSPYPVVSATLTADLYRKALTDSVQVYVNRYIDSVEISGQELLSDQYRLSGFYVTESNMGSYSTTGNWPALHAAWPGRPAYLIYKVKPLGGASVQIGGRFYRQTSASAITMSISADNGTWSPVWTATQISSFSHMQDVTALVSELDWFYVRYEFMASPATNCGCSAGLWEIKIVGVEPPADELVWSGGANGELGNFARSIDLSPIVARPLSPAAYHYLVRFVMQSPTSPLSVGLNGFTLTTMVQVAPRSLPALGLGVNQVEYADLSTGPVAVQVTQGWKEIQGPHAPVPPASPLSPTDGVSISMPFSLTWQPATDPDGDPITRYHVMLCERSDCRWPLSAVFDVDLPNADPAWALDYPYHTWLNSGQTYYWRVKARDATGFWSDYSQVWSFTVREIAVTQPSVQHSGPTRLGEATWLTATIEAGTGVTYTWDLGDGNAGSGPTAMHTYTAVGQYAVIVTASNSLAVLTATTTVHVNKEITTWLPLVTKSSWSQAFVGPKVLSPVWGVESGIDYVWDNWILAASRRK